MKKLLFISIATIGLFASCQKVIDVDLNSKDPQLVIEGNVTDQPGPYTVQLTKTVNFSESNTFPGVSGATVTIADNVGNTETLNETSPGIYQTSTLQGTPGRTYTLTVVAEGKTYTASSTMPNNVPLDSVWVVDDPAFGKYLIPVYYDPAGKGNYYRVVEYVNHERNNGIFIYDDAFNDGLMNGQPLFDFETEYVTGDTIDLALYCIDKPVYQYYFSLEQTVSGQTGAPANPESNISNKALGYFSVHTVSTKRAVIQ